MGSLKSLKSVLAAGIGLIALFAIAMQFILSSFTLEISGAEYIVRFFSYFTILSNVLVMLCCCCIVFSSKSRFGRWITKPASMTAITLYILVVGIIYNGILRFLLDLHGMMQVVDELLHVVIPLSFFLYWWFLVDKSGITWNQVFYWMVFPLIYLLYTLCHGAYSDFYPYPFVNVTDLGMGRVLINSFGVTFVFLIVGLLLIAMGK